MENFTPVNPNFNWDFRPKILTEYRTQFLPDWKGRWYIDHEFQAAGEELEQSFTNYLTQLKTNLPNPKKWRLEHFKKETIFETGIGMYKGDLTLFHHLQSPEQALIVWSSTESSDDSFSIIYTAEKNCLVVGVHLGHPFVLTPEVAFENSDGSTHRDLALGTKNAAYYLDFLLEKANEYIFQQVH